MSEVPGVIPEVGQPVPGEAGLARTGRLMMKPVEAVSAALLVVIVSLLLVGVASRYVFSKPIIWIDEVVSISFIWIAMLGSAIAVHRTMRLKIRWRPSSSPGSRGPMPRSSMST